MATLADRCCNTCSHEWAEDEELCDDKIEGREPCPHANRDLHRRLLRRGILRQEQLWQLGLGPHGPGPPGREPTRRHTPMYKS